MTGVATVTGEVVPGVVVAGEVMTDDVVAGALVAGDDVAGDDAMAEDGMPVEAGDRLDACGSLEHATSAMHDTTPIAYRQPA